MHPHTVSAHKSETALAEIAVLVLCAETVRVRPTFIWLICCSGILYIMYVVQYCTFEES